MDLNILKHSRNVVTKDVHTSYQHHEKEKANQVSPDVPSFVVQSKHALKTTPEREHRRSVTPLNKLIISEPLRKGVERNDFPSKVSDSFQLLFKERLRGISSRTRHCLLLRVGSCAMMKIGKSVLVHDLLVTHRDDIQISLLRCAQQTTEHGTESPET